MNNFLFSSVQSLSRDWTAAGQASLSITNSQSLLKLMSIELVITSNHLILCCPLLLLLSIFSSIRVFSNESVLHIRWPEYWSFSFSISPSNEYSGLISFRSMNSFRPINSSTSNERGKNVLEKYKLLKLTQGNSNSISMKETRFAVY